MGTMIVPERVARANCVEGQFLCAARHYWLMGWSIIPVNSTTKRAAVKWTTYQAARPPETRLKRWFGAGGKFSQGNLAVVFGSVSGDLACRDWDDMDSYDAWAAAHRDLASTLPTVRTKRGKHTYFLCRDHNFDHLNIVKHPDGELRLRGCYCVLPPSRHPEGSDYHWLHGLPGSIPQITDIRAAGLVSSDFNVTQRTQRAQENSENSGELRKTQAIREGEEKGNTKPPDSQLSQNDDVAQAILESMPTGPRQRHRMVFDCARRLKAIPELREASLKSLKPIVRRWHAAAIDHVRSKSFDETWSDFTHAWPRVKQPKGDDALTKAISKARASPLPSVALEYDDAQLLVSVCYQLQLAAGDQPFFIGCRSAGSVLGVSHATAARYLAMLCADGVLARTSVGTKATGTASEYRYLAGP